MVSIRLVACCASALFIAQAAEGQGSRPGTQLSIVDPSRLDVNRIDWAHRRETTTALSRNVSSAGQARSTGSMWGGWMRILSPRLAYELSCCFRHGQQICCFPSRHLEARGTSASRSTGRSTS
jgi:hypothetical protein